MSADRSTVAARAWAAVERLAGRYDALALQNVVLGATVPVLLLLLLAQPDAFRPDRTWWVLACAASFVFFGVLAAVRRRVGPTLALIRCFEALAMIPILGSSSDSLGLAVPCVTAGPLVLVIAATVYRGRTLALLAAMCLIAVVLLLRSHEVPWPTTVLAGIGVTLLATIPAVVVLRYRTDLGRAISDAERLSLTDPLTGLLNRNGIAREAPELVHRARRDGLLLGVMLLDVDHFKHVNDTHGHDVGDEVLCRVAGAVQGAVRQGDLVARYGGEEILVVATCRTLQDLAVAGERVRSAVAGMTGGPRVTVSVGGAATAPGNAHGADVIDALTRRADIEMYEVKALGRNAVRVAELGEAARLATPAPSA